jgi:hypothetical protein
MDDLNITTPIQPDSGDLQKQYDDLRHLVVSVLILFIVMSGTLNIYLLRQWRSTSRDLAAIRPQAAQMIGEYQKVSGPLMNEFIKKITEYGRSHPDFAPIMAKYGIRPTSATNALPAAPATPVPKK